MFKRIAKKEEWDRQFDSSCIDTLIEAALNKGPGSWENDVWLPVVLRQEKKEEIHRLDLLLVGLKKQQSKIEKEIALLKAGLENFD